MTEPTKKQAYEMARTIHALWVVLLVVLVVLCCCGSCLGSVIKYGY